MRVVLVALVSCFMSFSMADANLVAMAKMRPMEMFPHTTNEIMTHFKADQANPESKQTLELAGLANDVFSVKSINTTHKDHASVTPHDIVEGIRHSMRANPSWNTKLSESAIKTLKERKDYVLKLFGEGTYEWAWVQHQLGEKSSAKKALSAIFEREYGAVMKLDQATFGFGGGPLSQLEPSYDALKGISDEKEKSAIEAKMQKAKKHISSLPQSHIMT